jgi:hypothetical protein
VPILSGGLITEPLVEDVVADTPQPSWTEQYGNMSASWVDPDGVEWDLSNDSEESPWFTVNGPAGWGANLIELVTDPLPRGGEQVRFVRAKSRRIQWPLYIGSHESHLEFVARYRQLLRAITRTSTKQAPGWLRIKRQDGRYRQIACYYEQGLEGESGENHRFAKPVVTFYCPDGYWSGDRPINAFRQFATTTSGGGGGGTGTPTTANFFAPFFNVASSKIVSGGGSDTGGGDTGGGTGSGTNINNPGDVAAWPVWTIKGPMTYMIAENRTVGTRFALRYNLLAEQTITITTNRPSVRGPGAANLTGKIDWFDPAGCELWPLADGDNEIAFRVDGADAGTRVDLNFTPRDETA